MSENMQDMRPQPDESVVNIPITFSRRAESIMSVKTIITSLLVSTALAVIFIIIAYRGSQPWYFKYPIILLIAYGYTYFLRFFILLEGRKSDAYETLVEDDLQLESNAFWGIYDVSKKAPYVVYFMNGLKGIFVQMDKDIIVGKPDNMSYRHFEGIAEMYKTAHDLKLNPISIDYMDNVGNDPRMNRVHAVATQCENPELKGILTSMFANLEREMELDYNSFDVYLFTTREREEELWYKVKQVVEVGKQQANYISYSLFRPEQLRKFTQLTLNLDEFSMLEAQRDSLASQTKRVIRPIELIKTNGEVVELGKTTKEIEEERAKLKNKKKITNKNEVVDEYIEEVDSIDIFEKSTILEKDKKKDDDEEINIF